MHRPSLFSSSIIPIPIPFVNIFLSIFFTFFLHKRRRSGQTIFARRRCTKMDNTNNKNNQSTNNKECR